MGYYNPKGQRLERGGAMGLFLVDPETGKQFNPNDVKALIDAGYVPDLESIQDAKAAGYTGGTSAETIAEKQIKDWDAYSAIFDPTNGTNTLAPEFTVDPTQDMAGAKSAYSQALGNQDELMAMAKDTALTPYAKALMDRQALEEGKQRSDLAAQTNTSIAAGQRVLGSTGGYDSGARERLLLGATRGQATGGQDIGRESAYSRLGITSDDLNKKFDILKGGTSAYSGLSNVAQGIGQVGINTRTANIDRTIEAKRAAQAARDERFKQKMAVTGSTTTSQAM